MPHHRSRSILSVLAAAALWGVSGVVARALFRRAADPSHLVQFRMMIGGAALVPVALARGGLALPAGERAAVIGYALCLAGVQLTYFKAIQLAGVAVAIFLQYTAPILLAGFEAVRDRRLPERPILIALAAATSGSLLLVLAGGGISVPASGIAWGLASAFGFAAATLLAGRARARGVGASKLLVYGLLLGSLAFTPLRTPWAAVATVPSWPGFLFVAIFATAVPFGLYVAALAHLPGSVALLLAMLEPVLAALLAWAALGEALSALQLAGGALILSGVTLAALSER